MLSYNNSGEDITVGENYITYNEKPINAILSTQHTEYPFEIVKYETFDENQQLLTGDIVEPGKYTTTATITYDENNIEIDLSKLTYKWSIDKESYTKYGEFLFWYVMQYDSDDKIVTSEQEKAPETLTFSANGNYFLIGFTTYVGEPYSQLNIELSIDDGNTYVEELKITEAGTYTIKVRVTGQDLDHYEEIDVTPYEVTFTISNA